MELIECKNLIYTGGLYKIGGVETCIWEQCRKYYKDYDITVVCHQADPIQLERVRKYCRVIVYKPRNEVQGRTSNIQLWRK